MSDNTPSLSFPHKHAPSGYAIGRAMAEAQQLRASLIGPDSGISADDQAIIDTIEGETDVFTLLDRLAEHAIADEALVELARTRAQRLEQRADRNRDLILRMLQALELRKCERALYTASVSHHAKTIINDAAAIPAEYQRHAPDMQAIGKALRAGESVPGTTLSNEMPRLTLRTK